MATKVSVDDKGCYSEEIRSDDKKTKNGVQNKPEDGISPCKIGFIEVVGCIFAISHYRSDSVRL